MSDRRAGLLAGLLVCALAGCGGGGAAETAARDSLSRRERDSILGASKLPGAPAVRRTLEVSDSAAARAARINAGGR